jgi:hypothetical protein
MNRKFLTIATLLIGFCPLLLADSVQANQGSLNRGNSAAALNFSYVDGTRQVGKNDRTVKSDKNDAQRRYAEAKLERLKANYDDAVKQHGVESWTAFMKGRYLVQCYIDQDQLDDAVQVCESLVLYCRISTDDIKSGASWNELRPSEKQDQINLILCLTVLSELNSQKGKAERAALLMDDARKTFLDYQMKNSSSREQSFEQFIELNSVPNAVTQSRLSSLLNWRVN